MADHTPTPWNDHDGPNKMIICDAEGGSIADCAPPGPWMAKETAEANANFICLAANAHAGLLELAAEAMWKRDYPNGGSVFKNYESLNYHDKQIHRGEALTIALAASHQNRKSKSNG